MNIRKKILAISMVALTATFIPQKTHCLPSIASFVFCIAILPSFIVGATAGTGYSAYKYFTRKSSSNGIPKDAAEITSAFLDEITNKYNSILSAYEGIKTEKDRQNLADVLQKKASNKKTFLRMLRIDLKEMSRVKRHVNRWQKKLISGNKYKDIDNYEQLKELAPELESMNERLINLQKYIQQSIDLF